MTYAFLFPGQGSQKVGMGEMFQQHTFFQDIFEKANEALGYDLQKICAQGPIETLTLSKHAQPAILTVSTIAYKIFTKEHPEIKASYVAGHSLGEYSALVAAEAIDFSDAVKIVHRRGALMQQATPEGVGAMAAILGKEDEEVSTLCEEASDSQNQVSPANFNAKGQVVVSGHKEAVLKLLEKAKGKLLQVSAPFHCPLMKPIKQEFGEFLANFSFQKAKVPVVNNVQNDIQIDNFPSSLLQQIDHPVLWRRAVELMIQKGVTRFLEFGEGAVLSGLCKRIHREVLCSSIQSLESINKFEK
jgi:[acyl-carrier-protein] S-malonyltransferase